MQRRAECLAGAGGLPKLQLDAADGSRAEIFLQGAQLTSWVPAGESEAIFLSRAARFAAGQPIRGGIPVIFPQFADLGPFTRHGFARTQAWEYLGSTRPGHARLCLRDSQATRGLWPHAFEAELNVEVAARSLSVRLSIANPGAMAFDFSAALHAYFRVGDVALARVHGLQGAPYRERASWQDVGTQEVRELAIKGAIDRVYVDPPSVLALHDPALGRVLNIQREGFRDTVIWNPGPAAAAAMTDLEASEHREMLCIEAAQVIHPVKLAPGDRWSGAQRIELPGRTCRPIAPGR